jgi:hypothetical protein
MPSNFFLSPYIFRYRLEYNLSLDHQFNEFHLFDLDRLDPSGVSPGKKEESGVCSDQEHDALRSDYDNLLDS